MATSSSLLRRIQLRRDTADKWNSVNPVLAEGEIGYETTGTNRIKIGNGVTGWNSLNYFNVGPTGKQGFVGPTGNTGPTGPTGNTGPPFMTIQNAGSFRLVTATGTKNDTLFANSNLTFNGSNLSVVGVVSASVFRGPGGSVLTPLFTDVNDLTSGVYFPSANVVGVSTNQNERVRVDNSGIRVVSGTLRNLNGSVTAPTYTFTSDLSAGLYRPATNKLGLVTAGVERLTVDAAGQIGINRTAPSSLLDVNGTALISNVVVTTDVSVNRLLKTPNATITSNVTTSTLTASSDISSSATLYGLNSVITSNVKAASMTVQNDISSTGKVWANNVAVVNTLSTAIVAASSDVSANGMVRAPTLFATSDVSVNSNILLGGTLRAAKGSVAAPPYTFTADTGVGMFSPATNNVAWTTASVERMRILANGNVGIDTQTPTEKLHVSGNAIVTSTLSSGAITTTGSVLAGSVAAGRLLGGATTVSSLTCAKVITMNSSVPYSDYVCRDENNTVYFHESKVIKSISPSGIVTTITSYFNTPTNNPKGIAYYAGSLYVVDNAKHNIMRVNLSTMAITLYAGSVDGTAGSVNDVVATDARFNNITGLAVNSSGVFFVVEASGDRVRSINLYGDNIVRIYVFPNLNWPVGTHIAATSNGVWVSLNRQGGHQLIFLSLSTYGFLGQSGGFDGQALIIGSLIGLAVDSNDVLYILPSNGNLTKRQGTTFINSSLGVTDIRGFTLTSQNEIVTFSTDSVVRRVTSDSGNITATGSLIAGAGSSNAPSYTFSENTAVGMFSPTTNALGLSTNGSERMRILSNGNVGINTTTPGYTLDVNGTANVSGNLSVGTISTSGGGFSVPGNLTGGTIRTSTTGSAGAPAYTSTGSLTTGMFFSNTNILAFTTTGVERMRINDGTTTITGELRTSSDATISNNLNVVGLINAKNGGLPYTFSNLNNSVGMYNPDGLQQLAFKTNGTDRLFIQSNGFIGIGTITPGYTLDVNGSANVSGNLSVGSISTSGGGFSVPGNLTGGTIRTSANGTAGAPAYTFTGDLTTGTFLPQSGVLGITTGGSEKMRIQANGNIGIGTPNPAYVLDVNGNAKATDFIATSDRRLKTDIQTISNALDIVKGLHGVYFTRIGETQRQVGVIAQEVEEVLPEVVHTSLDDLKSVSYGNIVGVLIEALKDVSKRLEKMENKE